MKGKLKTWPWLKLRAMSVGVAVGAMSTTATASEAEVKIAPTDAAPLSAAASPSSAVDAHASTPPPAGTVASDGTSTLDGSPLGDPKAADEDPIEVPAYAGARAVSPKNEIRNRFRTKPYMQRFKPEDGLFEVGMYAGFFMPNKDHSLYVEELPREGYYWIAGSIGGRFAYFPLSFLGVEIEGFGAGGRTQTSKYSAIFYTVRSSIIAQLPLYSVTPFILGGAGALGAANETMGHDRDFAGHFGIGVKIPTSQRVSSRIDIRDTLGQKFDAPKGALTHYLEGHVGVTFVLNRTVPSPPRDQDYDGLVDSIDECPRVGALTINGCPPPAPEAELDEDGDGLVGDADECPSVAGPAPSGCADQDLDKDGIFDLNDKCVHEPETVNHFEDTDGCPDEIPADLSALLGPIAPVTFKKDSAELEESSHAVLDERAAVLKKYGQVKALVTWEYAGEENDEKAQRLATERASALVAYLTGAGAAEGQLKSEAKRSTSDPKAAGSAPLPEARLDLRSISEL